MKKVLAAIYLAICLPLFTAATVHAADCQFVLGFKTLLDLIGHDIVGECLEDEHYNATGDSVQQTTGGLLVWRKADNWTAFTDGYRTWIKGPYGLEQRLNTQRFLWEPDYAPGGGIATSTPTPAPVPVHPSVPATIELNPDHILAPAIVALRTTPSGEAAYQELLRLAIGVTFGGNPTWGRLIFDPPSNRIVLYGKYHREPPHELAALIAQGTKLAIWSHTRGEPATLEQCIQREYNAWTAFDVWKSEANAPGFAYGETDVERYRIVQNYVTFLVGLPLDHEFNDPVLCPAVPRVQGAGSPRPVPDTAPTPTPAPPRFVDPLLKEAFGIMRTTEYGEIMYQAYLASEVNYIAFAHLDRHGGADANALFEPWNNRILLDESLRDESHFVRVAWLVHESVHAWRHVRGYSVSTPEQCYEEETFAFRAQAKWWYEKFSEYGKKDSSVLEQWENIRLEWWLAGRLGEWVRKNDFYRNTCAQYAN